MGKKFEGIPIKKQAKYLGVPYNRFLSISFTLNSFQPKIQFIFFRLYRLLKTSEFRVRYNLWQVFVSPLYRMALTIAGEPNSQRARLTFNEIRQCLRRSLKKFTLVPRSASQEFFDSIIGATDARLTKLLEDAR